VFSLTTGLTSTGTPQESYCFWFKVTVIGDGLSVTMFFKASFVKLAFPNS
jgi:hypothetical protein